jgi:hypothetical protein
VANALFHKTIDNAKIYHLVKIECRINIARSNTAEKFYTHSLIDTRGCERNTLAVAKK